VRDFARSKRVSQRLLVADETLSFRDRVSLHGREDFADRCGLLVIQSQGVLQLHKMRRTRHAVQFRGLGQPPAAAAAQLRDVILRKAFDSARLFARIGRGRPVAAVLRQRGSNERGQGHERRHAFHSFASQSLLA
jgi:hypothetical protein